MKNTLVFLFVVSSCAAYAASTCETRVDNHPDATTRERVVYCLSQEPQEDEKAGGPELVYSGSYSVKPKTQTSAKSTVKNGRFKQNRVSVRREYVGSNQFPAFDNDLERTDSQDAYEDEADQFKEATYYNEDTDESVLDSEEVKRVTSQRAPARLSDPALRNGQDASSLAAWEARGLKARQQKPKRFMMVAIYAPKEAPTYNEPSSQTTPNFSYDNNWYAENEYDQVGGYPVTPAPQPSAQPDDDDLLSEELGLESDFGPGPIPPADGQN